MNFYFASFVYCYGDIFKDKGHEYNAGYIKNVNDLNLIKTKEV